MNNEIREEMIEKYYKGVEVEWKNTIKKCSSEDLLKIYGRQEVLEICQEKINELIPEYDRLKKRCIQLKKYIDWRFSDEVLNHLYSNWLNNDLIMEVKSLQDQIERLYLLSLKASGTYKQPKNTIPDGEIERAREYPTYQLYKGERLIKSGSRYMARCTIHNEKSPSLVFYPDGGYYCFGCHFHGSNAIDYLMTVNKLSFQEAVRSLS